MCSSPNLLFLGPCVHKCLSEFLAAHGSFRVCRQAAVESSTAVSKGWLYQLQSWMISGESDDKESACNAGDTGSIPEQGRSPGEGNDNPLQYSCLGNPMDRGTWQAIVHGVTRVGPDLATKPPPHYII